MFITLKNRLAEEAFLDIALRILDKIVCIFEGEGC